MSTSAHRLLLLLALAALPAAHAAEAPAIPAVTDDEPVRLPVVEVTDTVLKDSLSPLSLAGDGVFGDSRSVLETPRAATTLTPAFLDGQNIDSVTDLAAYAPGVSAPGSYGLLTTPMVRGDTAETYVNGQRLSYNLYGYLPSFNSVEAVDLVRGPASAVFGTGYLVGGYVNYRTKQPSFDEASTVVTTRIGTWVPGGDASYANATVQIDHTAPLNDELAYRLSYEARGGDTFYQKNGVDDDRQDIFAALSWRPEDGLTIDANVQYFWQNTPELLGVNRITQDLIDHGIYQSDSGPVKLGRDRILFSRGDSSDARIGRGQVIVTREVSPDFTLVNRSLYEHVDRDRFHLFGYREDVVQDTVENRTEARFGFEGLGREHKVVAGLALRFEDRDVAADYDYPIELASYDVTDPSRTFPISTAYGVGEASKVETFNPAVFWQHEVALTEKLSAIAGFREDFYLARGRDVFNAGPTDHADVSAFSQAYSLVWRPRAEWTAYLTHNRMLTQNTNGSAVGGGYYFNFGPSFQNDDFRHPSELTELGVKAGLLDNRLFVAAALFQQERARVEFASPTDIIVRGLELETVWHAAEGLDLYANATFQQGRYEDALVYQAVNANNPDFGAAPVGDHDLLGFSEVLLNGGARYRFACGFGAGLNARWQSGQDVNIPDPDAAAPYDGRLVIPSQLEFDGSLFYERKTWSASLDFLNLTNERNWIHNGDAYTGGALITRSLPLRVEATVRVKF